MYGTRNFGTTTKVTPEVQAYMNRRGIDTMAGMKNLCRHLRSSMSSTIPRIVMTARVPKALSYGDD
jgi:hypothetical protein